MSPVLIITIVSFFIIFIISIISYKLAKRRKNNPKFNEDKIKRGAKVSDIYQGISYSYIYFRGGQNSPPYFDISIDCESYGEFKISKETKFDRFFKKIGIASEMETHDPDFDSKYYISSNTPDLPKNLLSSEIRIIVDSLISRGFTTLILKKNKLHLKWVPYRTKSPLEKHEIEELVSELGKIQTKCSRIYQREVDQINTNWKTKRLFAFLIPGTLEILGVVALIIGFISYPPLDKLKLFAETLTVSIPVFFLYIWIAIKLLKGRSSSHRELIIVFFISITAFPLAFGGGKAFLNGWMDKSESITHNVQIINKYITKSKDSKNYYIKTQSWREGRITEKLSLSRSKYNLVIPGSTNVTVVTKEGKFGYEWIENYYLE